MVVTPWAPAGMASTRGSIGIVGRIGRGAVGNGQVVADLAEQRRRLVVGQARHVAYRAGIGRVVGHFFQVAGDSEIALGRPEEGQGLMPFPGLAGMGKLPGAPLVDLPPMILVPATASEQPVHIDGSNLVPHSRAAAGGESPGMLPTPGRTCPRPMRLACGIRRRPGPWSPYSLLSDSTAMNASCGISTLPTRFMRALPSFCFSSSFRFRLMSPP
jgi:hypothetical protein